jgi:hypothetical protein
VGHVKEEVYGNKSYTKDNLNESIRNYVFSVSPKEV